MSRGRVTSRWRRRCGGSRAGDSPDMVAAREAFLAAGHYRHDHRGDRRRDPGGPRARDRRARRSPSISAPEPATTSPPCCTTAHAGERVALDASRPALRRAARAHPRIAAVACDVWQELPLQDASAELIVNVFAPRNGPEIARVLRPAARWSSSRRRRAICASSSTRSGCSASARTSRSACTPRSPRGWSPCAVTSSSSTMTLGHDELHALVAMGPSAHHLDSRAARRAHRATAAERSRRRVAGDRDLPAETARRRRQPDATRAASTIAAAHAREVVLLDHVRRHRVDQVAKRPQPHAALRRPRRSPPRRRPRARAAPRRSRRARARRPRRAARAPARGPRAGRARSPARARASHRRRRRRAADRARRARPRTPAGWP